MSLGLDILKTMKLYVNGEFIRGESGSYSTIKYFNSEKHYAHVTTASRKDLRGAVESGVKAQESWAKKSAYNRGQILYRMAEMLEGKRLEFIQVQKDILGFNETKASKEVDEAIESFIYYAGFSDKYSALVGNINPINGPFHNFTTSDPMGLVTLVTQDEFKLGTLTAQISAVIVSGNSCLVLLPESYWGILSILGEVFATSDLTPGAVNILATKKMELLDWAASHMEIKAISFQSHDAENLTKARILGVDNMKRVITKRNELHDLLMITDHLEFKTSWHPVGF